MLTWIFLLLLPLVGKAQGNPPLLRRFPELHCHVPAVLVLGESFRCDSYCSSHLKKYRCPTECQLKHSRTPWTCKVSLQLNIASDGSPLASPQKIPFGQPITEKSEVTERIRRAQRAILNPSMTSDTFLLGAIPGPDVMNELPFSANRIVLHITGSDVADLNFIDLPGLWLDSLSCVFYLLLRSFCRW